MITAVIPTFRVSEVSFVVVLSIQQCVPDGFRDACITSAHGRASDSFLLVPFSSSRDADAQADMYEDHKFYYLILDLVSGGEMFDHLINYGAYSEADAARLMFEIASALAFMHGVDVVYVFVTALLLVHHLASTDSRPFVCVTTATRI
jgi:hypothetical protein